MITRKRATSFSSFEKIIISFFFILINLMPMQISDWRFISINKQSKQKRCYDKICRLHFCAFEYVSLKNVIGFAVIAVDICVRKNTECQVSLQIDRSTSMFIRKNNIPLRIDYILLINVCRSNRPIHTTPYCKHKTTSNDTQACARIDTAIDT